MNKQITNSGNISTGEQHRFTADLNKGDILDGKIYIPALGFTKASVGITVTGTPGTVEAPNENAGTVAVQQSVANGGKAVDFATPVSLNVTPNSSDQAFDIEVSGGYVVITPSLTYTNSGRIELIVILKR